MRFVSIVTAYLFFVGISQPAYTYIEEGIVNGEHVGEINDRDPMIVAHGSSIWSAWLREDIWGEGTHWYFTQWEGDEWAQERKFDPPGVGDYPKSWLRLAMDGNGNPHAVWAENTGNRMQLFHSIWENSSWRKANQITHENVHHYAPALAISPEDMPCVVWTQPHPQTGRWDIWGSVMDSAGWTEPEAVERDSTANDWEPSLACTDNGNLVAVWHRYVSGGDQDICYSIRHGSTWAEVGYLTSTADEYEQFPHVEAGSGGAAWAVWQTSEFGEATRRIQSARWNIFGWQSMGQISELDSQLCLRPKVCLDPEKNPWAVWWTSSSDVYLSGFDDEWGISRQVTYPDSLVDYVPDIAADGNGVIWVVWEGGHYYDGYDNNIYFGRFDPSGADETNMIRPSQFVLGMPFPNPCRSGAWVPFESGGAVSIEAGIYNAAGRRVRILSCPGRDQKGNGSGSVFWDGKDAGGVPVRAGAYIIRIKADDTVDSRRIIVLP